MPITVEVFAQYLTVRVPRPRESDYRGQVFIHALKGHQFKNYAKIRARDGTWKRVDAQHPEVASEIFVEWGSERILQQDFQTSILLVPVPNKRFRRESG